MKEIWYQFSPYFMLGTAAIISIKAAHLFFTKFTKKRSLNLLLSILLFCGNICWIIAYALRLLSENRLAYITYSYIIILLNLIIPALWFYFTYFYITRKNRYPHIATIFLVLGTGCLIFIATNGSHHLVWEFAGNTVIPRKAVIIPALLSLTLICAGGINLFRNLLMPFFIFRWQAFTLFLAIIFPVASVILEQMTGNQLLFPVIIAPYSYIASTWLIRLTRTLFSVKDIISISRGSFFENINDAILVMDKTGNILDINPAAKLIISEHTEDILRKPLHAVHPLLARYLEKINTTNVLPPFIRLTLSGKTHFYDIEVSPFLDWDGKLISRILVLHDITERKTAEEAMRKSESKLRNLIRQSIDGILIIEPDGQLSEWNEGMEKITGIAKQNIINQPAWDVFSRFLLSDGEIPVDPTTLESAIRTALQTGEAWYTELMETNILHPQGIVRTLQQQTFPIKTENGYALGSIIRDITENKLLEAERIKSGKLEALGILAGGIAHDFNNALTAIVGNISLAKLFGNNDKLLNLLKDAEEASTRARDLTYQLLIFARGGAPSCETASITEIIKTAADFTLHGTNIECELKANKKIWPVEVDIGQMNQALCNLILNAVEAMPRGGKIQISMDNVEIRHGDIPNLEEGRYVKVMVIDEGCGIPMKNLHKIFDPYFTTKPKGNGLGLAITWAIFKGHHGFIQAHSIENMGSNFTFFIRASNKPLSVKDNIQEIMPDIKARVLVMDDDATIRMTMKKLLEELQHNVTFTEEGSQAITQYKQALNSEDPFDLVILDLTIKGGMGGKDTMAKLLEIDTDVKAIVSSGYSNDTVVANYKKYGFKACLSKPYNLQELKRTINTVLNQY